MPEMGSTALWLMLLLGAYHGINPGMGWLFAVALGMQEQKGSAVARALVPIALGHALAIGIVVLAAAFLGMALPLAAIRYSVAAILFGLGIYLPGAASPPALGPHAGGLPRPDALVVSDGLGARRGFDGGAGAAGQQHGRSGRPNGRPQSHVCCWPARLQHCSPPASIRRLSCSHRADRLGGLSQVRSRASPQGLVQPGFDMGCRARGHRLSDVVDVGLVMNF